MKDKVALVTGGSGGIGTAIARYLHDMGARVGISYNKGGQHQLAIKWQSQQKSDGYDFEVFYGDITNFESTKNMIKTAENKMGAIDILVNNAGTTDDITLKKMSLEQWTKVIDTNLNSIFNVTRNILNNMIERQYGRIVNISSINGQKGQFGQANYCASKAGIHGFTKALSQEVAKYNITVNTVSPGYVKTNMIASMPKKILDNIISLIPVGRLAEPIEIARVVAFLSSKEAAFITGANFAVNGGQHMY